MDSGKLLGKYRFEGKLCNCKNGAGDRARTGTGWNPEGF